MNEEKKQVTKLKPKSEYKKLNNRTASAYKPRAFEFYIRDTELRGYYLRIQPTGYKSYGVAGKLGSSRKNVQITIGAIDLYNENQARVIATDYLQLLKQGIDPRQQLRKQTDDTLTNPTLIEMHGKYVENKTLKPKTVKDYQNTWEQPWIASLGKRPIKELTHMDIVDWYNKNKTIKARQTEKTFTMIGASFKHALACGVITDNIFESRVKPLVERVKYKPKDSFLAQDSELPAFLSAMVELSIENQLNETHRDWILFAMLYGLRAKGASLLQWDWIDMDKRTFYIPPIEGTKLDHQLNLPLTYLSEVMIMSRFYKKDKHKTFVFPDSTNTQPAQDASVAVRKIIKRTQEKLNNPEFHTSWHDWRATWQNVAISAGIPLDERERILGHSQTKRTSTIYSREVFEPQRKYLDNHNRALAKGMEYAGELFMMYVDDEGIDKDFIIENLTDITAYREPEPVEEVAELDMFKRFAKQFNKETK